VLDVSRFVVLHERPKQLDLVCDFLPSVSLEELEKQLQRNASEQGRRPIAELLPPGLPRRLTEALAERAGLPQQHRASALTREQRQNLAKAVKQSHLEIRGTMGFKKAEVTTGGVLLKEIDSRTMQSKLVPGLFMAGEILDLDGPIGGYNFQAAFSTGWLAGSHA
jgi:predicted Rossmann fold flavoprotein